MVTGLPGCYCLFSLLPTRSTSWLCCLSSLFFPLTHQENATSCTPKVGIYVILNTSVTSRKEGFGDQELQVGAQHYSTLSPQTGFAGSNCLFMALSAQDVPLQTTGMDKTHPVSTWWWGPLSNIGAKLDLCTELGTAEDTFLFGLPNHHCHLAVVSASLPTVSVKFLGWEFKNISTNCLNSFIY